MIPHRTRGLISSCIMMLIKQQLKCATGILKKLLYIYEIKKERKTFAFERLLSAKLYFMHLSDMPKSGKIILHSHE